MTKKYFGTDGIRGRVGEGHINPEFVLKLGWAVGRVLCGGEGGRVLIGKDTRISGYMFESALEAGLVAAGVDIQLLGPLPTPGIAHLVRTMHADAGIVISASHNPYQDNGIKFFAANGYKLSDEVELAIERELELPMITVAPDKLGKATRVDDAAGRYIEFCKSTFPAGMDLRGMRIVVDAANGATYHITPQVLSELGAKVIAIGVEPNGFNINDAVGSTHPEALQKAVVEHGADLGIALDGDGDRVLMVDHQGQLIDGDEILYIIAMARLAQGGLKGKVVGTLMSNLGLELALTESGIGFERTDVGDRYVLEQLLQEGGSLGGESSGHIICLGQTTTGDGTVAALQVLSALRTENKSLHQLLERYKKLPQVLINVRLAEQQAAEIMQTDLVQDVVRSVETELGENGRVLLRPSGTEPLIRVMVEGRNAHKVAELAKKIADVVEQAAQ